MKFVRKKTIDLTKDDDELLEYVAKRENTDQTNAIRIALAKYKENEEQIKLFRKLVANQEITIEMLKSIIEILNRNTKLEN